MHLICFKNSTSEQRKDEKSDKFFIRIKSSKKRHNYHLKIIIQNRLKNRNDDDVLTTSQRCLCSKSIVFFLDESAFSFSSEIDCLLFSNKQDDRRRFRRKSNKDFDLDDDESTILRCDVENWAFFFSSNDSLKKLLSEARFSFALFSLCFDFFSSFISFSFDSTTSLFETFVDSTFFFSNDSVSSTLLFSSKFWHFVCVLLFSSFSSFSSSSSSLFLSSLRD